MKNKREITIIIIISMVLIFFFSGLSMGKELSKIKIDGIGKIAKPIVEVENGEPIDINNNTREGTYEFKVKNYNQEGERTGVDMEYYVEILTPVNNNFEFSIYKNEEKIEFIENKTDKFLLSKNSIQEDNYKIELKQKENITTPIKNLVQEIQIKVHSEQKKV